MARDIVKGFLNRAAVSMRVINEPTLNIYADQLSEEMISFSPQGAASDMLPTATGVIASPIPYMTVTIAFKIVKTSGLAQLYLNKLGSRTFFGDVELTTDSSALQKITINNVMLAGVDTVAMNGKDASVGFTLQGYLPINNDLF